MSSVITQDYLDRKRLRAKRYSHEGSIAGVKTATIAAVATAAPMIANARVFPGAKSYVKPPGQALITSIVAGMTYFIVADKTVLAAARRNSFGDDADKKA